MYPWSVNTVYCNYKFQQDESSGRIDTAENPSSLLQSANFLELPLILYTLCLCKHRTVLYIYPANINNYYIKKRTTHPRTTKRLLQIISQAYLYATRGGNSPTPSLLSPPPPGVLRQNVASHNVNVT